MEKATDAFRTISEVAEDLDLPQHVLRFWETKFNQIRPMKRGGGRRYYRPDDVELLRGIQYLLYGEGYTIKGVQRILKEQGARFVMEVWRHPGEPIPGGRDGATDGVADSSIDADVDIAPEIEDEEPPRPAPRAEAPAKPVPPRSEPRFEPRTESRAEARSEPRFEPSASAEDDEPLPAGILPETAGRSSFRFMDRFRSAPEMPQQQSGALSRDDIRRLQSTLFELLECKRLLDQTR